MKPTKLKMCIAISQTIAQHGPLRSTQILPRTSISHTRLNDYLDFLINQCVIESRLDGKTELSYAITERGTKILRYFKQPTRPTITINTEQLFDAIPVENIEEANPKKTAAKPATAKLRTVSPSHTTHLPQKPSSPPKSAHLFHAHA